ncbi:MAG: CPBP family intramembrane glutamic endopeptidase [Anaerolineae bacterium]
MEITALFTYIFVPLYIGVVIYIANQVDLERTMHVKVKESDHTLRQRTTLVRLMLYGLISMLFVMGFILLQAMLLGPSFKDLDVDIPEIDLTAGVSGFAVAVVGGFVCLRIVRSESTRAFIRRILGIGDLFDPNSVVHLVAIVLLLWYVCVSFVLLVMAGGVVGLAQSIAVAEISAGELVFQGALLVALAVLGVGMLIRRSPLQTLERLALKLPSIGEIIIGGAAGIGLIIVASFLIQIWGSLVTPEQFAEQSAAANEIGKQITSLGLAFVLATSAAVSEEILFRGALQPVLGVPLTALFFTLFHNQYSFTPAAIIIFVVGLALGLLRKRYSTSVAIIVHFTYDFLPFFLLFMMPNVAERMGIS